MWNGDYDDSGIIHVYPQDEQNQHDLVGTTCRCDPRVEISDSILVVHNSFDGREMIEEANAILKSYENKTDNPAR